MTQPHTKPHPKHTVKHATTHTPNVTQKPINTAPKEAPMAQDSQSSQDPIVKQIDEATARKQQQLQQDQQQIATATTTITQAHQQTANNQQVNACLLQLKPLMTEATRAGREDIVQEIRKDAVDMVQAFNRDQNVVPTCPYKELSDKYGDLLATVSTSPSMAANPSSYIYSSPTDILSSAAKHAGHLPNITLHQATELLPASGKASRVIGKAA